MFEDRTYENILNEMLNEVPHDLDKREGSIIYDALAPAALKMAQVYVDLKSVLALGFADTSNGQWLDMRVNERGLKRKEAIKTIREAKFKPDIVKEGTRFFIDGLYFKLSKDGNVECEISGEIGNEPLDGSSLVPVNTIPNLEEAKLGKIIKYGRDKESDEELLDRYIEDLQRPAENGNKAHYEKWATEVNGVGDAKVFPREYGPNTVKVVIIDSSGKPASQELVKKVQNYIDPESSGLGEGVANLGAKCTVKSATKKIINISVKLELGENKTIEQAKKEIGSLLNDYLVEEIAFKQNTVRITNIGNIILSAKSVIDYSDLKLNGETKNIELKDEEVPILGEVSFNE
ncbi:baseplate J/gp47 family protein [Dethiothermospora halolimnae]|uniref:baseplate J/gp47 family protein n=1 Tax=Dethiothermospora halolimnae TaxID=3114390 RepID=UPI003CCBB020